MCVYSNLILFPFECGDWPHFARQLWKSCASGGRSFRRSCAPFTNNFRSAARRFFWPCLFLGAHQRFTFNENSSARTRLNLCAEFIPGFIFCRLPGVKWIFIFGKSTGLIYKMELKIYIKTGKWRCVKYIRRSIKGTKKCSYIWIMVLRVPLRGLAVRAIACKKCPVVANWKQLNDAKWNMFQGLVWFSGENIRCSRGQPFCGAVSVCCLFFVVSANFQVIYHSLKNVKFYSVENITENDI